MLVLSVCAMGVGHTPFTKLHMPKCNRMCGGNLLSVTCSDNLPASDVGYHV